MDPSHVDPLQYLHDTHLPSPITTWPLAPGWYILAAIILLILAIATVLYLRHCYKTRTRKQALKELEQIQQQYHQQNQAHATLISLSELLRRAALSTFKREEVAGLQGKAWLLFLDKKYQGQEFSQGVGRLLITGPYQAQLNESIETLFPLVQQWIRRSL